MMNPQYPPPGQNNNAPNNPMFPQNSQDYNGVPNANIYSQMPPNGPQMQQKQFEPMDMSQKMQNMSINGPQGFQTIPSTQLPPGQASAGQFPPGSFPQTSNFGPGQAPLGQAPQGMSGRPPVSGAPQFPPMGQKPQMPPSSAPGQVPTSLPPGYGMPPPSQTPDQNRQFQPPISMQQRPSSTQPSQPPMGQQTGLQGPGHMPPHSQSGLPPQPGMGRPAMPPQGGQQSKQGMPSQPQMGGPPDMQPGQQGMPQMNIGPQSQQQPGMPPQSKPGLPGQPQPSQMQRQPGLPPQPGMMSAPLPPQPGQQQQPGQIQSQQQQPGQMPGQPAKMLGQQQMPGPPQPGPPGLPPGQQLPPQPGQMQGHRQQPEMRQGMPQPGQIGQPGMPPQPGQMSQSGMPPQPGQMSQPGMPPQHGQMSQPGMPPQPGHMGQPGMPPQPGQMSQPGMPPQPGQMGQPGMPPQPGQMSQPGMPPQPGQMGQPGMPPQSGQIGQPRMPPLPGQIGKPGMPPQPGMNQPGMPPQPGPMSQPGLPPQPGQLGQSGQMPPQSGQMPTQLGQMSQPGLPPQPGQLPSQPGLPPQPGFPGQFQGQAQTLGGLPHMPPPLSQQRQYPAQPVNQQGYGQPGQQPGAQYPNLQPMPNQMPPQPPMPGQQQRGFQPPSSGYPPQYQQAYPGQQPYPGQQYQQQPEQKRLDPDQMPSPIQVMADDQQNRGGIFVTNEKGLVPPLATTDFVVDDKGNASPRYIRSSMYTVPVTADLLKQTSMPFCLVLSPMAETVGTEQEPPLIDFAALTGSPMMGPVRCSRCKAYMCPNMKFVDAGRHFKCAFCKATTEVPMEYTQYINSMQQYGRVPAEMALGAYEIVATKEYCRNNSLPNAPAIVFVIDVSYNAIKNGLVNTVCENIMEIIDAMPRDEQTGKSWTRVGFITYSSTVHFYNIKGSLAQPQMMSVGDVSDMFVPLLEGFLVLPEESGPVLQTLLQQLPLMFQDNKETETILLPAVQAGLEALKAADTSGQLLVFHTSLPTYNAPGKLINREDRKLLGTDKEKQILAPQTTAYNELGQSCCAAGVCVEMFVCNNSYIDAATIGQLPRLTGGQLHKYTYFTAEMDGPRLVADVQRVASRATAHDAVMRVRTSTGVRPTDFFGHFFMSNTTDVELAAMDADKAIGIEIKHDDKLTAEDGVYIQAALLYTHRSGQRRLRVLNLALNVAHQLADVYRSMELDTCINFLTKQAVWALREHSPRQVRESLSSRCARSLAAYRRHCASPSSAGQLVLPEPMKLLPLYTNCVLRSDALAGGPDLTCDDRSCAMYRALAADVETSVVYTYPRLLPLHRLADQPADTLQPLRATVDKMNEQGVYLLENGVHMLLWIGSQANPEFIQDVFGVQSAQQVDTQVCELPVLDTPANAAVRALIDDARARRRTAMRLTTMRQHDKLEAVLRHFLVEDRGVDGSSSYVDYLCHIHKEIRALL